MINKFVIIISIWCLLLAIVTSIITLFKHQYQTIDVVISRYNEDLEWLRDLPLSQFKTIYIYNKGENNNFFSNAPNINIITLPNVGRESHTYLYHINTNYERLGYVTIFLPGSAYDENGWIVRNKRYRSTRTIQKVMETRDSVFVGMKVADLKTTEYDFVMNIYQSHALSNRELNPSADIKVSALRPFGKWYEYYFGNISVPVITYTGIFAVSRKHIHNRSMAYYQDMISTMDDHSNVEVGHYLERSYAALFHPIPHENIYFD